MTQVQINPYPRLLETIRLYNCLHHAANSAVRARAIRSGAWPEIDINPNYIEQTFLHRDCMGCLMGKVNTIPRSIGVRIKQDIMGYTLSVDWKPVSPVAIEVRINLSCH